MKHTYSILGLALDVLEVWDGKFTQAKTVPVPVVTVVTCCAMLHSLFRIITIWCELDLRVLLQWKWNQHKRWNESPTLQPMFPYLDPFQPRFWDLSKRFRGVSAVFLRFLHESKAHRHLHVGNVQHHWPYHDTIGLEAQEWRLSFLDWAWVKVAEKNAHMGLVMYAVFRLTI